jgi:hypothetical protein
MSNYIRIQLDTTLPEVEILAPNYTTREEVNSIIIQANEALSTYQEVYVIDNNGNRYDYTFNHQGDHLTGQITFNDLPYGVTTIYAQVKDVVWNQSHLVSKSINLIESTDLLSMETEFRVNNLDFTLYNPHLVQSLEYQDLTNELNFIELQTEKYIPDLEIEVKE